MKNNVSSAKNSVLIFFGQTYTYTNGIEGEKNMNEKLQYAEMLEIPVSTCTITRKTPKKRSGFFKKLLAGEDVKQEVINKVNVETESAEVLTQNPEANLDNAAETGDSDRLLTPEIERLGAVGNAPEKKKKRPFSMPKLKFNVVGVELLVIGLLAATILLTNILVPNSGINVFFKSVFGTQTTEVKADTRKFDEFTPVLPVAGGEGLSVDKGVMTISKAGSVYSPCDGKVTSLDFDEETKTYTMEITHSDNFKTVFKGITYAYSGLGGAVFSNIPVAYVKENATMCFYGEDGAVIDDYTVENNSLKWAV